MTALAVGRGPDSRLVPTAQLQVNTVATEALRATVRVTGVLSGDTIPLLTSVLTGHLRSGRRYLRVELTGCVLAGRPVLEPLRTAHAVVAEGGGMLVFDHADEPTAALLRRGDLFVSPAA